MSGAPPQSPLFWSTAVASQSAPSAAGVTPPVTKWKYRGPDEAIRPAECPSSSVRAATAPFPLSSRSPPTDSAASSASAIRTRESSSSAR